MRKLLYFLTLLALIAGFILTIISYIRLCSSQCVGTHDYRIWGVHFETIGMVFFPLLLFFHILAWRHSFSGLITAAFLVAALGSELVFIGVQKFMIGSWCPVCLSIAATVALASLYYLFSLGTNNNFALNGKPKGALMNDSGRTVLMGIVFVMGFTSSLFGISKIDPMESAQSSVKESIAFGNEKSAIEFYLFTDWQCPACRKLEKNLGKIVPSIVENYKLVYVDFPIHPETMNYTPYNLSFMHARAEALLEHVGLGERMDFNTKLLSGGEKQRVAIARAFCNNPDLILADEPTGNLDKQTADPIHAMLIDFARKHSHGLVVVTHDPALAALCDVRYRLQDGVLNLI